MFQDIPSTIHLCGRINPANVFDYLSKIKEMRTKVCWFISRILVISTVINIIVKKKYLMVLGSDWRPRSPV
jgi:hypothetical protein